jgi:hypothetical protein
MPPDLPDNDVTVYLVLNDYRTGVAYVETALDEADLETIIRNFIAGEYDSALRVVAFNAAEGWSHDAVATWTSLASAQSPGWAAAAAQCRAQVGSQYPTAEESEG